MARFELTLEAEFAATHRLRMYDGQFEPMHGHRWRLKAYYEGDRLDEIGVLADFTLLHAQLREIAAGLNDRCLNDLPSFAGSNPSAENVARHIYDTLSTSQPGRARLTKVRVWEAPGCAAAYCG